VRPVPPVPRFFDRIAELSPDLKPWMMGTLLSLAAAMSRDQEDWEQTAGEWATYDRHKILLMLSGR